MKLSYKQFRFLHYHTLKIDSIVMFPRFGFSVYETDSRTSAQHIGTNPLTGTLDNQSFHIKEFCESGLVRGNFLSRPLKKDFYLDKSEIERRDGIQITLLYIFVYPFMVLYNVVQNLRQK